MAFESAFKTVREDPHRYIFLAGVVGTIFVLDQITKTWIQETMRLHESIPIIDRFFSLTYIRNAGAAFGLFAEHGNGLRMAFFVTISVVAIVFLLTFFTKMPKEALLGRLSVAMVMGGALGNLVDRVRFGEVVDFLDFYISTYHWPAFNVADSCISVGVSLLILYFIRTPSVHA